MSLVSANGATDIIYIKQESGIIYYKINSGSWLPTSGVIQINNTNSNASSNILKVYFTTDININNAGIYFTCNSDGIQYGNTSLNSDGSRTKIFINNVSNYPGFIQNGYDIFQGKSNIYIYNITIISNSSFLAAGGGWLGQNFFASNGKQNYIINCSSNGYIGQLSYITMPGMSYASEGGIVGVAAAWFFGEIFIYGCSSSGIIGKGGGGIVARNAAMSYGKVICKNCWSSGDISENAGGIVGIDAASYGYVEVDSCYTTGNIINNNAGGIIGFNAVSNITVIVKNSYTTGNIYNNSGGILGNGSPRNSTVIVSNCYTLGNIGINAGGISKAVFTNYTISNSYTVGSAQGGNGFFVADYSTVPATCYSEAAGPGGTPGSWNTTRANAVLEGIPIGSSVGSSWVATAINTPYELNNMGYSPYTTDIITLSLTPSLIQTFSQTIQAGNLTSQAILSNSLGNSFTILKIENGTSDSYNTFIINSQTGAISTTRQTIPGIYKLIVRSTGSYNITAFELTILEASIEGNLMIKEIITEIPDSEKPMDLDGLDYETRNKFISGNTMIGSTSIRRAPISYSDMLNKKMAYAAKR